MTKFPNARSVLTKLPPSVLVVSLLLLTSGCGLFNTHKKVQVPQLLPLAQANKNQLIQEVSRLSAVRSIHGKVDIHFQDTSFASVGIAEQYRSVDGTVTLQRP